METADRSTFALSGYRPLEQLYCGARTVVYRALQEKERSGEKLAEPKSVVIKLLHQAYPSFNELVQFRNQYTITKNLDCSGIVRPYSLEPYQNSYALVMEDFGGISLERYVRNQYSECDRPSLPLEEVLAIALQLTDILHCLTQNRIIHKDIKPNNILINPDIKTIKLTDFSIASLLPNEIQEIQNPQGLEGTLAYLAPEQTGRMNRGIDYRSDFYALGVTLFELLAGRYPFESSDPMELIHCHIAQQPPSLEAFQVPKPVADIVLKLMAKNAEDRYQSAVGLKQDLEFCLTQLRETGQIEPFRIGQRDLCNRFTIPEKLYGRETEVRALLDAFDRISEGDRELLLVAGFSGIGKTAVVKEVHKPIVRQKGYFARGKFDQFQRNVPLSAFIKAFQDLIRQILSESDDRLQNWQEKILNAVGENGRVLIDVIPELELIIGHQPPVVELSGNAAQNRFNLIFQKFVRVLATREHPLVVFLDDLQWADVASLNFLKRLAIEADTQYLLLLGAYRDNEVFPAHPLMLALKALDEAGVTTSTITLEPLSQSDLNRWVADTLTCSTKLAQPLTEFVYQKTRGNPFFASQFLKSLHDDGVIKFQDDSGYWQCDLTRVQTFALTDDVVEFMALQLKKLPTATQELLKFAACIGNQFDLETLAVVSERTPNETASDLWIALREGLLIPLSKTYKFFQESESVELDRAELDAISYRFLHDRIQQAAYGLIPDDRKQATHYKMGTLLLQKFTESEREDRLFEIISHLNLGRSLIVRPTERKELTQFNLKAGQKAKSATAYASAIDYFNTGIELLPDNAWSSHYNLTLNLHVELTEATYLNTDFEGMAQPVDLVLKNAKTLLDRVPVCITQVMAAKSQGELMKSLKIGFQLLHALGIELPEQPTEEDIGRTFQETQTLWEGRNPLSLLDLPTMSDRSHLAAMQVMTNLIPSAYMAAPQFMPLLICKQVELSIRSGNCAISTFAYADYGLMLCGVLNNIEAGYEFGQLALALLERLQAKACECRSKFIVSNFIRHWKDPVRDILPALTEAYQVGLEIGDLESIGMTAFYFCCYSYLTGKELTSLCEEMEGYRHALQSIKQQVSSDYVSLTQQAVLNLLGKSPVPWKLSGDLYDIDRSLPIHEVRRDSTALFHLYFNQTILCYLFEQYEDAVRASALVEEYLGGGLSQFPIPVYYFYDSLVRLSRYPEATEAEQKSCLERVAANQQKMQLWASLSPGNHRQHWELVEAQRYAILGEKAIAIDYFDRAVSSARSNGFLQEEALANELAAKFYRNWGKDTVFKAYIQEAYYCYARWGATAKIQQLERDYSLDLNPRPNANSSVTISSSLSETVTTQGTIAISEQFDLAAILQFSQALSGEIELDRLLSKLLSLILTTSGAQQSCLLLVQNDRLFVQAFGQSSDREFTVLQSIPLEDCDRLSHRLANRVAHTREIIVLDNASQDGEFTDDPYIIEHQCRSILCTPLVHQGHLKGIVYLENNLSAGAFTRQRLEIVRLLSAQAAISLENALLYQQLEDYSRTLEAKVEERTAEIEKQKIFLRRVIDTDTNSIFVKDKEGRFILANRAVAEFYGTTPEDLIGKSDYDFVSDREDAERFQAIDRRVIETQKTEIIEEIFTNTEGVTEYFQSIKTPLLLEENLEESELEPLLLGVAVNITERKQAEIEIQNAKEAADAANQAKSEFLSHMSHELRTPLNGILGYAQIFQRDSTLTSEQQEGIQTIYQCGTHLLTLINDILDLSKIEAQKLDLYPGDLHFSSFLQSLIDICRIKASQKNIAFTYRDLGNLPAAICADEKRLRQVLLNLLGNAIKFTDRGGVTLEVETLAYRENASDRLARLRFSIRDTGVGMSPEELEQIFIPFEQVGSNICKGEGTGLGLAITYRLLEMMGSSVRVKSQIGEGSTFWFEVEFPVTRLNTETLEEVTFQKISGYCGRKRCILIVDDRWENHAILRNILEPLGFVLTDASNGREGIDRALEDRPDLIVVDLVMPVLDGFETIRRLRSIPEYRNLPIVACSASTYERDREKSGEVGSDDFLPKPIDVEQLLSVLQKHLDLEWVYESASPANLETVVRSDSEEQPGEFVLPPREVLIQLYDLAQGGLCFEIEELLVQLNADARFVPFVTPLLEWTRDFETERLRQFLQSYLGDRTLDSP
ncbi:hypothetical protein AY599_23220 [Leptolyngbya valderiana BDU 20041]|nr:hypothetical protein AY599_23220 [Leptolyngbya valderiana BDU 20041]PPT09870.1 Serine/threonine protein kinase PrkC regulator of stationary phase [Geitlerinema sp. FC II]